MFINTLVADRKEYGLSWLWKVIPSKRHSSGVHEHILKNHTLSHTYQVHLILRHEEPEKVKWDCNSCPIGKQILNGFAFAASPQTILKDVLKKRVIHTTLNARHPKA